MTPQERHLVWFLRFSAIVFLCAIPFIFAPTAWMRTIAGWLEVELPHAPIMEYLTRSVSAVYAVMGASYWYMSRDVRRYLPLLRFNVCATIAFDIAVIIVDVLAPMPIAWTVGEAVSIVGWTAALWWLVRRVSLETSDR